VPPAPRTAASARLDVVAASGGLCLVQDLLNSAAIPAFDVPDLLEEEASANGWLEQALVTWSEQSGRPSPRLTLDAGELVALRDARTRTRGWLARQDVDLPAVEVRLRSNDGRVVHDPTDEGAAGVLGLVLGELLLAGRDGSLDRLKTCANPACAVAFYDLSRNSSRVWHDVRTCGNVANLRASRARRRSAGAGRGAAALDEG